MNPSILPLSQLNPDEQGTAIPQAECIFFETSGVKEFKTPEEKSAFRGRYFDTYLATPELFLLAMNRQKVTGYLAGSDHTTDAHYRAHPYLELFRERIRNDFPAHLHINLSFSARGTGLGSFMIREFEKILQARGVKGLHIVTLAAARNVSFYQKNGFTPALESISAGKQLLLMGKHLSSQSS